jgi:hypothetical protein
MPTAVGGPPAAEPARSFLVAVALAFVITCAALALATTTAHAEEVFTSQAAAANATDSTWIPAPEKRAALCIVDTGNDQNPDTTNVIARLSVDGGDPGDLSPDHHGTLMSMIAAAPYNGWGMVGAAPSINIVSVRASRDGLTFGGNDLTAAVQICVNKRSLYNIKIVSMSLGGAAVVPLDAAAMATAEDAVESARRAGLNVVAAAGNHDGPVDWPAAYAPVLAIGAAADAGARCAFSASGPEVDLWAPGCPVDASADDGSAAWASGTSESTAFVAAILTQLRQARPSFDVDDAETLLSSHSRQGGAGPGLDVASAYTAAGLSDLLDVGRRARPSLTPGQPSPVTSVGEAPAAPGQTPGVVPTRPPSLPETIALPNRSPSRLAKPVVASVRLRHATLDLALRGRPPGAQVVVAIYARRGDRSLPHLARSVRLRTSRLRVRARGSISEVSIAYRDPTGRRSSSAALVLHPREGPSIS